MRRYRHLGVGRRFLKGFVAVVVVPWTSHARASSVRASGLESRGRGCNRREAFVYARYHSLFMHSCSLNLDQRRKLDAVDGAFRLRPRLSRRRRRRRRLRVRVRVRRRRERARRRNARRRASHLRGIHRGRRTRLELGEISQPRFALAFALGVQHAPVLADGSQRRRLRRRLRRLRRLRRHPETGTTSSPRAWTRNSGRSWANV